MSPQSPVPFVRRKSVVLGEGCHIETGAYLGPGTAIATGERVPAHSQRQDVEDRPLYYLNLEGQLCIDHEVLETYYNVRASEPEKRA
jgi:NDP-sugar pyrophosphorylase family protein